MILSFFFDVLLTAAWFFILSEAGLSLINFQQITFSRRLYYGFGIGMMVWMMALYLAPNMLIRTLFGISIFLVATRNIYLHKLQFRELIRTLPYKLILIALTLSFLWILPAAFSGWEYSDGYRFYGVNAHDGMWHVALMESLSQTNQRELPTFAGQPLKGYHYLIDLTGGELQRLFGVSPLHTTFRIYPFFFSLFLVMGVYFFIADFATQHKLSSSQLYLGFIVAVLLIMFGGSLAYILPLLGTTETISESAFWMHQGLSTWINLPLGASFALLLLTLNLAQLVKKKPTTLNLSLLGFVIGAHLGIKAYGGILALVIAGILCLHWLKQRHFAYSLVLGSASLVVFLLVGYASLTGSEAGLHWEPGWFIKTMFEAYDRLNWPRWELMRLTFIAEKSWPAIFLLWSFGLVVFVVGNMSARLIGILAFSRLSKLMSLLFGSMLLVSLVIPLLFIQKGVVWNTIQFGYYGSFLLALLCAIYISTLSLKRGIMLSAAVLFFTLPTSFSSAKNWYQEFEAEKYSLVSQAEYSVLATLATLPPGSVLSPYDENATIPAFSGKPCYFCDKTQAVLLVLDYATAEDLQTQVFQAPQKPEAIITLMKEESITYLYLPQESGDMSTSLQEQGGFEVVAQSGDATLLTWPARP